MQTMLSTHLHTAKLAPLDATQKAQQQTEDILNSIIPPREFADGGQLWVQQVSSAPATRLDVIALQVSKFFLGEVCLPSSRNHVFV